MTTTMERVPAATMDPPAPHINVHQGMSRPLKTPSTEGSSSNLHYHDMSVERPTVPIPPEAQIDYYGLALVFLAPALGGFLYGYDIGATSFVLAMLRESRNHDDWWHGFPKFQQGLLVSTLALGALLGSHIVFVYLAKSIGRRKEIRIAASLYIIGAMLNVMSGTILAETQTYGDWEFGIGICTLICGRLLYGAGVGFIMHGAPTYMAEMSPSTVRGTIVSAKETVIVFGIVVGMLMGDLMSDYPDNWTDLYAFSILGAVPMLLLTFKIPRSKRWLLMKGYREEAKESMQFVYKGNIEDEFERMADTINNLCCRKGASGDDMEDDTSVHSKTSMAPSAVTNHNQETLHNIGNDTSHDLLSVKEGMSEDHDLRNDTDSMSDDEGGDPQLFGRRYRPIMFIGLFLLVAQQFSGQPSVLAYSRVLLEAAGWKGHASVVTVVIMGITSTVTVALVDRLGRRTLLLTGCGIMAVALSALTYGFWGWDEDDEKFELSPLQKQLVLWSMFVFISGYQVGYGPITWTVLSEIYPSEIRGTAMALSVEVNFLAKFLCQLTFPMVQDLLGWGCTFIVFIVIVTGSFFFIWFKVPETTGMTLEEIQIQLRGLRPSANKVRRPDSIRMTLSSDHSKPLLLDEATHNASQQPTNLTPIV